MPLNYFKDRVEDWVKEDGLELDPDFQRGHVWTEEQQVAWVEYFLRGGKSGRVIYLNAPWWNDFRKERYEYKDFVLVDGLQRASAFLKFFNNELEIFGGNKFEDFEDKFIMCKASDNLRVNINTLKTKKEVLTWYIQMNEGGTPHTAEEIGKVRDLLKECGGV